MFFLSDPRCFGPLGKFQHNIKVSSKTARVSRLSVSYDYGFNCFHVNTLIKNPDIAQKCSAPDLILEVSKLNLASQQTLSDASKELKKK